MHKLEMDKQIPDPLLKLLSSPVFVQDGANILLLEDGSLMLIIVITNLNKSEINEIRKDSVRFRMYTDGNVVIPLIGIGVKLKMELPFNPTVYNSEALSKLGNRMDIVLVERSGAILKGYRTLDLGQEFVGTLKKHWLQASLQLNWKDDFKETLTKLYKSSVDRNWGTASSIDWEG